MEHCWNIASKVDVCLLEEMRCKFSRERLALLGATLIGGGSSSIKMFLLG